MGEKQFVATIMLNQPWHFCLQLVVIVVHGNANYSTVGTGIVGDIDALQNEKKKRKKRKMFCGFYSTLKYVICLINLNFINKLEQA